MSTARMLLSLLYHLRKLSKNPMHTNWKTVIRADTDRHMRLG